MNPSIDITRLEKVRSSGHKITARCPACSATGNDRTGTHFFLNQNDGKFGCAAYPGDSEHRREIFALVGIKGECQPDPDRDRQWRMDRAAERRVEASRAKLSSAARSKRNEIISDYRWTPADVWDSSPQKIDCHLVEFDPRHFLQSLFPQDAIVWTGEVHQSGVSHADRWRTVLQWQNAPEHDLGAMVAPARWKPATVSRATGNVLASPYTVLDFDGFDGIKPETPDQLQDHISASLAITRWLIDRLDWKLAAILWSGGKSIHAWFHTPPPAVLESLRDTATALGVDAGLIGRAEHPCRLPGQTHAKTGKMSNVLWLQIPPADPSSPIAPSIQ